MCTDLVNYLFLVLFHSLVEHYFPKTLRFPLKVEETGEKREERREKREESREKREERREKRQQTTERSDYDE